MEIIGLLQAYQEPRHLNGDDSEGRWVLVLALEILYDSKSRFPLDIIDLLGYDYSIIKIGFQTYWLYCEFEFSGSIM